MVVPPGIADPARCRVAAELSAEPAKNTAIAGNVTGDKYREMLGIWWRPGSLEHDPEKLALRFDPSHHARAE
jgi:hypothetical protein